MIRIISRKPDRAFIEFMLEHAGTDLRGQPLDDPRLWFVVSVKDVTGEVIAGLSVEFLHNFDGFCSAAITDPQALTRRLLNAICSTLYARVTRLTATVEPGNQQSILMLDRLGFVYEGFLRRGLDGVRDAELWGMLAEECRYLPGFTGSTIVMTPALPVNRTAH